MPPDTAEHAAAPVPARAVIRAAVAPCITFATHQCDFPLLAELVLGNATAQDLDGLTLQLRTEPAVTATRQWTIDGLERPAAGALGGGFTIATLTTGPFANTPRDVTFTLTIGRMDLATAARGYSIDDITLTPVPEPAATAALLLAGGVLATGRRRRRR